MNAPVAASKLFFGVVNARQARWGETIVKPAVRQIQHAPVPSRLGQDADGHRKPFLLRGSARFATRAPRSRSRAGHASWRRRRPPFAKYASHEEMYAVLLTPVECSQGGHRQLQVAVFDVIMRFKNRTARTVVLPGFDPIRSNSRQICHAKYGPSRA